MDRSAHRAPRTVQPGRLTRVAVGPLHVQLHVALLREAHDAVVAPVGPLPRVLLHVHLQRALLVEGLLAEGAVEWPLPWGQTAQSASLIDGARRAHTAQSNSEEGMRV